MTLNATPAPRLGLPLVRMALIGAALGVAGLLGAHSCHVSALSGAYALELTVEEVDPEPRCYFGSQWNNGPMVIDHDAAALARVEFHSRYPYVDGCWWEVTEVLVPESANVYRYHYAERVTSCVSGAEPGIPCSRTGRVDVVPLDR